MRKLVSLAALALAASVSAQSPLTTTFANNNGGGVGGGNYFNLTAAASDVTIGAIECNLTSAAGTAGSINIYLIAGGTYVGNQAAGVAAWGSAPVDSGNAIAAGAGVPTFIPLTTGFTLLAGTTYGVAYEAVGLSFAYTNGDGTPGVPGSGTNQAYATTDLLFEGGSANNLAFTGAIFDPRVCNTSLYYVLGPGPAPVALANQYGAGCYDNPITYYEEFLASTFDMSGDPLTNVAGGFQLIPNGVGGYVTAPGTGLWYGDDGTGAANIEGATLDSAPISASILNSDDAVATIDLASISFNNLVNVPGGNGGIETSLTVDSNGRASVDPSLVSDFSPTAAELCNGPQSWALFWSDLSPNISGGVHWDVDAGSTAGYLTFANVPDFGAPAGPPANNCQMAIFPGGLIELRYGTNVQGLGTFVGLSVGGGVTDPGSSDIYDSATSTVNIVDLGAFSAPPTLASNQRPIEGQNLDFIVGSIDPTVVFGAILASFVQDIPGTDLAFLGMPGCSAHIDPFVNSSLGLFFPAGANSVTQPFATPVPAGFVGLEFFCQAGLLLPGANAQNVVLTNGLQIKFGLL
jgi:hypothetical protein